MTKVTIVQLFALIAIMREKNEAIKPRTSPSEDPKLSISKSSLSLSGPMFKRSAILQHQVQCRGPSIKAAKAAWDTSLPLPSRLSVHSHLPRQYIQSDHLAVSAVKPCVTDKPSPEPGPSYFGAAPHLCWWVLLQQIQHRLLRPHIRIHAF
jgi:hypothetical protein